MSVGLLALLDDVAGLAKLAAASLDDVAGQAAKAGMKAAGAVVDDAAVTPRYVHGFAAERELPMVARIALGSIRNKLLFLLPGALALSLLAPWAITPLLMLGGAYLCYEGAEKLYEALFPHAAHAHEAALEPAASDPKLLEDQKVSGAIKTDFILSAEIMTIALASLPESSLVMQAAVLGVVALGITAAVYGGVALIVKADDIGLTLATNGGPHALGQATRSLGRALVQGMPGFMTLLGGAGTAAMIWVGGGIIVHGLEAFGFSLPAHLIHDAAIAVAGALPAAAGFVIWLVESAAYGIVGLAVGAALIPLVGRVASPAWRAVRRLLPGAG
ncbi:DUF808 domain-containing protein [Devosia sp.]|uniref:DUF808 domain-containing protein n=1 Tax=Devosia sp. TaxID=1871048 RepID=UPI002F22939F